ALEDLAVGLVKKSEDIEKVMRSFEELVTHAFDKAEGRTRDSVEQIRSSISDVVETATQRFADATAEIRRTANMIRGELEETRTELRKGVLDLPEETKETTTAMRRAVTDQINALKELSEIVARSGRPYDKPEPRPAAQAPRQPSPPRPAAPQQAAVMERPQVQRPQQAAP